MGTKNRRLQAFLQEHPLCCYCGGNEPATTEDHWPPRSVFNERKWPDGYVFPACDRCQMATPNDEALFALICRMTAPGEQSSAFGATNKLMRAVAEREPEIYRSFLMPANQKRKWLKERDITLPPGLGTSDVPVVSLAHPNLKARIRRCATKLFLSLHYLHTKKILPSTGGIVLSEFSNVATIEQQGLEVFSQMAVNVPEIRWQRMDVTPQFKYRFSADARWGIGSVFLVQFNDGVGFGAICIRDLAHCPPAQDNDLVRPFSWGGCHR